MLSSFGFVFYTFGCVCVPIFVLLSLLLENAVPCFSRQDNGVDPETEHEDDDDDFLGGNFRQVGHSTQA